MKFVYLFTGLNAKEDAIMSQSTSEYLQWLEMESLRERELWLPWRPDEQMGQTEEDCEDPECIVQFQDISSVLFPLKSEYSKFVLILQFLTFLGVDVVPHFAGICKDLECHSQSRLTTSLNFCPVRLFQFKFSKSSNAVPSIADLDDSIWKFTRCENFVYNLIANLISSFDEPFRTDLKIFWCKTKLVEVQKAASGSSNKNRRKSLRKDFRTFLQQSENRNDHRLWLLFAQFEFSIKNYSDSEKVLDFLLVANRDNSSACGASICRVYGDLFLTMQSHSGNFSKEKLIWILTCCATTGTYLPFTENSVCSSTMILKAKKGFAEQLPELFKEYKPMSLVQRTPVADWLACYAVFVYLTNSVRSTIELYKSAIDDILLKNLKG